MNKRLGILLLLCLTLSACGSAGEAAPAVSPLARAAGLEDSQPLLVIDGREIPAWQYLYWLAEDARGLEDACKAVGEPLDWEAPLSGGAPAAEQAMSAALTDTALCAVVEAWAAVYGCTLTPDETAALPPAASRELTAEQGQALAALGRQYAKLYQLYRTAGSPLAPAAGEAEAFAAESGLLWAEEIRISENGDREAARQQASAGYARLNAAEDPAAVFAQWMAEAGGGPVAEADWSGSLRQVAAALEPGQISGILEDDGAFVVLRRLAVPEEALAQAHFDSLLEAAAQSCDIQVSEAYGALRPGDFLAALETESGT